MCTKKIEKKIICFDWFIPLEMMPPSLTTSSTLIKLKNDAYNSGIQIKSIVFHIFLGLTTDCDSSENNTDIHVIIVMKIKKS